MKRSFLVWTYALGTIVQAAAGEFFIDAFELLFTFLLYGTAVYMATLRYASRSSTLTALQSRMLICATIGNVLYGAAHCISYFLLAFGAIITVSIQSGDLMKQVGLEDFLNLIVDQAKKFGEQHGKGKVERFEYMALMSLILDTSETLVKVITYSCLSRGYGSMLISTSGSRTIVKSATVHDIVSFALVSVFGLRVGQAVLSSLSVAVSFLIRNSSTRANASSYPGNAWYHAVIDVIDVVLVSITQLAALLRIATTLGERHVLASQTSMGLSMVLSWAVLTLERVLSSTLLILLVVWRREGLSKATWRYPVLFTLMRTAVVFFYTRFCWQKYRAAMEIDRRLQHSRILSSRM